MDILGLLKRLSIRSADDTLIKQTYFCPECCQESPGHEKFCEAGNAIDALESGRLVVPAKSVILEELCGLRDHLITLEHTHRNNDTRLAVRHLRMSISKIANEKQKEQGT